MVEDKDINILLESLTTEVNVVLCRDFSLCSQGSALVRVFFLHNLLDRLVISFLIANGCSL